MNLGSLYFRICDSAFRLRGELQTVQSKVKDNSHFYKNDTVDQLFICTPDGADMDGIKDPFLRHSNVDGEVDREVDQEVGDLFGKLLNETEFVVVLTEVDKEITL